MAFILPAATSVALLITLLGRAAHSAIGDPLGAEFQVNTYSTGAQGQPAVAPDGAGGFVVVWHSDGSGGAGADTNSFSIQAKRFTALGVPNGDQFQVNTYTVGPQREPAVAPDGAGGFVVVWQSAGSSGTDTDFTSIQGQRFTAAGLPAGGEFQVNTYTTLGQASPAVAADQAGGFVVVWQSYGSGGTDTSATSVQAQRFAANGAPVGGELQVNTYTTDDQYDVAAAPYAGGFVIVWASEKGDGSDTNLASIQAQAFGAAAPFGSQFQVNSYTTGTQRAPAVTAVAGGGITVVWQSDASRETDRSLASVQAQRFDAGGSPLGAQFQVNTYTTGDQATPAVGQDGGDGFVVVWASAGSTGTDRLGTSAQARAFDGVGTPRGPEFQVNTYTTSVQGAYAVGADGSGGFVVLWDSLGSAGSDFEAQSVQAQRFVGPNTPTTTTTPASLGTTTSTLPFGLQGLTGRSLRLKAKPGLAETSRLIMVSRDPRLTIGRGNRSLDDPVQHGATLTLSSAAGGFASQHVLNGAWKYVGKVGRNKGYKWKSSSSPIRAVVLKRGKSVKIAGRGSALGFGLLANPDPVRVELQIGDHLYCFEFGGERVTFRLNQTFRAKRSLAPAVCP